MDIKEILQYLPHRYPFLLVDRMLEIEPGVRARGLKNVTMNEPFFPGHFPHHPVMPGVLIIEAMAQAAALLSFKSTGVKPDDNSVVYFAGIDNARFKRPVVPGDQLIFDVEIVFLLPFAVAFLHLPASAVAAMLVFVLLLADEVERDPTMAWAGRDPGGYLAKVR